MNRHSRQPTRFVAWLCIVILGLIRPVYAQDAIQVLLDEHEHVFQESMTFRLNAKSATQINSVKLFYRVNGQTSANKAELEFTPAESVTLEHTEDMTDEADYLPPMTGVTYWWLIENEQGDRLKTEPVSFVYDDTRYTWEVLEGDWVRLYWHDQDQTFGQGFFDNAEQAASTLSSDFGVSPEDLISIVIYNSHQELMSSLVESSAEWTGAVNFSDRGTIAIGLGDMDWMERVIPHELTHAMLDQVTEPPFGDIPRWLHEGLAMRSEGGMALEERVVLDEAIENNTLISLRALNSTFADAYDQAILSYAESNSLINFIIDEYGGEKLGELIEVFAQGAHYDDAMRAVFEVDMDGMEDLWRAHIGATEREGATQATPVPTMTSTRAATPVAAATATSVPAATMTPTNPLPTATDAAASPTPTAAAPTVTPDAPKTGAIPCLGALPAMAWLVLFLAFRPRPAHG